MKSQSKWIFLIVTGLIQSAAPLLAEQPGPHISAKVTLDASTDYRKIGGSSEKTKVQQRQLMVTVDNRDKIEANNISVKWTIYGRSMKDNKLMVAKEGTEKTKVGALQSTVVKCDKVTIKGTPKHTVTSQRKGRGRGDGQPQITNKSYPAEGEEYYGYAVRVFAGGTLVDEAYSQPSLKDGK